MPRRFVPVSLGSPRFRTLEAGPVLVTHARFPPGLVLPPHVHERACIATTVSGAWESVLLGRPRSCASSTLLVEPAGERHSNHFHQGADVVVLQPDPSAVELLRPCARLIDAVRCFGDHTAGHLARRIAAELADPDEATPLAVEGLAFELLAVAARQAGPRHALHRPAWLLDARDLLHDGLAHTLRIADIAAAVGVHPIHLARAFRSSFGVSPAAYLRRARLERALAALADNRRSIAEIALDCGFSDQSHFTRVFRRHTGLTPARYRRQGPGDTGGAPS
jgi:AraC family transcriptional regulator